MFDVIANDNCSLNITNNLNGTSSVDGSILNEGTHIIEWTVTDNSGNSVLCSMSITVDVITSVQLSGKHNIEVWPNPAATYVNVAVSESGIYHVGIFDVSGKVVTERDMDTSESTIDVSELAKGMYVMKVKTGSQIYTFRLTLE